MDNKAQVIVDQLKEEKERAAMAYLNARRAFAGLPPVERAETTCADLVAVADVLLKGKLNGYDEEYLELERAAMAYLNARRALAGLPPVERAETTCADLVAVADVLLKGKLNGIVLTLGGYDEEYLELERRTSNGRKSTEDR
jgi:hypothetical protein